MAKDPIKINTPLELAYYKGNVVVNYKWKSPVCVTPEAQVPLTLESKFRMTPIKS